MRGAGFRDRPHALDARFEVPSETNLRKRSRELFELTSQAVKEELLSAWSRKPSFTTDLWTSAVGDKFLTVTLHFLDKTWRMLTVSLGTIHFPEEHDSHVVADKLCEVIVDR